MDDRMDKDALLRRIDGLLAELLRLGAVHGETQFPPLVLGDYFAALRPISQWLCGQLNDTERKVVRATLWNRLMKKENDE